MFIQNSYKTSNSLKLIIKYESFIYIITLDLDYSEMCINFNGKITILNKLMNFLLINKDMILEKYNYDIIKVI